MKLLWAIEFKRDKLWVKWVHAYYLKRATLISVNISANCSWLLRKIVQTRELLGELGGWQNICTNQHFSIKKVYQQFMGEIEKKDWKRLICNNQASPRSKFILWLALNNRLATVDRLRILGHPM